MNSGKNFSDIVPFELTNRPVTEIIGNRHLTVEGCRGIEEYTDIYIKVKTSDGIISAYGTKLNISLLNRSAVTVEGYINRIEFEEWKKI